MALQKIQSNLAVDAVLAVGTHVFSINPQRGPVWALVDDLGVGGTANLATTFDVRPFENIQTGTAPAQTFVASVPNVAWATGASANAKAQLQGPVTAVQVTVATQPVHVQIGYRGRRMGT